jgi:hypothetical protein
MSATLPSFVLGYHGCDKSVYEKVLLGKDTLQPSNNEYDWLGSGIYFWENDYDRALAYAKFIKENKHRCKSKIESPAVIGAILDLGYCLNLFEVESLDYVKKAHLLLIETLAKTNTPLPQNRSIDNEGDVLIRKLDCAVINTLHTYNRKSGLREYESIRSPFWEGENLYDNAGFKDKNHIQICIIAPPCIIGYFRPLKYDANIVY